MVLRGVPYLLGNYERRNPVYGRAILRIRVLVQERNILGQAQLSYNIVVEYGRWKTGRGRKSQNGLAWLLSIFYTIPECLCDASKVKL